MSPYSDPDIDSLMEIYYDADKDPRYLYSGSHDQIVRKLKDWVPRRMENNQQLMAAREKSHAASDAMFAYSRGDRSGPAPPTVLETMKHADYSNALDDETGFDNMRAMYLLDTLRHRGFTWPKVQFMPNFDGGVCSFLGTIDPTFDAKSTLTILEDKEHEERLLAKRAEIAARSASAHFVGAKPASKPSAKSENDDESVPDGKKREPNAKTKARAEQRKKAKARAKEGTLDHEGSSEASKSSKKSAGAKKVSLLEAGIFALESTGDPFEDMAADMARATKVLEQNPHHGILSSNGKIIAMGVDEEDAHARLASFAKAEHGDAVNVKDVFVLESIVEGAVAIVYTHKKARPTKPSTNAPTPSSSSMKPPPPILPQHGSKKKRRGENNAQWLCRILPEGEQPGWPGVFFDKRNGGLGAYGPNRGRDKLKDFLAYILSLG